MREPSAELTEGSLTTQKKTTCHNKFEQPQAQQAATQEDDALATTQAAAQTESTDQADVLDDILDDIESTLETNAEVVQQLRAKKAASDAPTA